MQKSRTNVMAPFFRDEANLKYSVIAVQEPWIFDENSRTTHHPASDTYELIFPDKGRARACFFVSKLQLPSSQWFCREHSPDFLSLNIKYTEQDTERHLWVHNVYRQPDGTDPTRTLDQLDAALAEPGDHLVVGDFNLHHATWGGEAIASTDPHSYILLETMDRRELELLLPQGTITRHMGKSSSTIDLALATPEVVARVEHCDTWEPADHDSDHRPILTILNIDIPEVEPRTILKWAAFDLLKFNQTLLKLLPSQNNIIDLTDRGLTELALGRITTALQGAIGASVPTARISKWSKPGFTDEIKTIIQRVKSLRRRWQGTQMAEDWENYRIARNRKGKEIAKCLTQTHRDCVERASEDPQGIWKLARWTKNRGTTRQNYTPPLDKGDGSKEERPEEKARLLHKAFFPTPPEPDLSDIEGYQYPPPLQSPDITYRELEKAIKKLKAGKAPGPDGVTNQALKAGATLLIPLWLPIMNDAMRRGIHPQAWKESITVALRKPGKGDYSQPKAYRPIALLNTMGKLMESVLAVRLSYWMESSQLIPRDHIGGRKLAGVEGAIHLLTERISASFGSKHHPVASLLMLDVSGAFDNVSHQRLLHNLRKRRVPGEVVRWIEGFLSQRSTTIKMPEFSAPNANTSTGIPQGSPLSPILYLFYNADLIKSVSGSLEAEAIGYIDDVGILVRGSSVEDNNRKLQDTFGLARDWAQKHASVFAPSKFAVHHFTADKRIDVTVPLKIDRAVIIPGPSIRVLGVQLDSRLTFLPHVRQVEATATKRIGCMKAIAGSTWGMSLADMRRLYIGAVRPQVLFGSSVWYTPAEKSRTKTTDNKKLRILTAIQKRAAAVITGAFRVTAGSALDIELHLTPISIQLQNANGEALIRIRRSPLFDHIIASRPPAGRTVRNKSPLERLQIHYGAFFIAALKKYDPVHIAPETIRPWVVPPWWDGPETWIAKDSEQAIEKHNYITKILSSTHQWKHHVYTDGSGYRGHVGAAAVSKNFSTHIQKLAYLGDAQISTVYAAELKGIDLALTWGLDRTWQRCNEIHIWTDNQAAIRAVADPNGCASGQYILCGIVTKVNALSLRGIKVYIRWIPAHVGVPGNERADKAAKEAATRDHRPLTSLFYLSSCLKQVLRAASKRYWAAAWDFSTVGSVVHRLTPQPTKETLKPHGKLTKAQSSIWVQLRTGKIALNKYLFDIGRAESPTCDRCYTRNAQTVRHVLWECPARSLLDIRPAFLRRCTNLKQALTNAHYAKEVTNYMATTGLLGQFRAVLSPAGD